MIKWQCPCGRQLKVEAKFSGRRVKCPACKTSQVVPETEQDEGIQETPRRGAPHAQTTPSRPPTRDRREDREPGSRKGRAKQSAGSGGLLIGLIVGGSVLLVLLAIGAGVVYWWSFADTTPTSPTPGVADAGPKPSPAPGPMPDPMPGPVAGLKLVPPDAPGFASVALADWWNGPHGKRFQQYFAQWDVGGEAEKILGVRPGQARRITAVLLGRAGTPAFIVSTTEPYDRSRVQTLLAPGGQQRNVGGKPVVIGAGRKGVHFADERTYVFGPERSLGELLSTPPPASTSQGGPLQSALALAEKHFLVIGVNGEFPGFQQMRQGLARARGPEQAKLAQTIGPLLEARVAHLTLDITEELLIDVQLTYTDTVAAEKGLTSTKATLGLARTKLGEARKQVPREWGQALDPAFNFLDALLRTTMTERQGQTVRLYVQTEKGEAEEYTRALVPAVQKVRQAATRMKSANNLKQMMLAMHNYADSRRGQFPTAAIYSPQGQPLLSWRVAILPYIEQENLYRAFHLNEPWDSPHNMKLLPLMPKTYAPVVSGPNDKPGSTHYRVFTGPQTPFPGRTPAQLSSFPDGTSNTILIVEAAQAVPWTKPDELVYDPNQPLPKLGGMFPDGFNIALADGSVRFVPSSLSEKTLRAAITPAGGEVLGSDWR